MTYSVEEIVEYWLDSSVGYKAVLKQKRDNNKIKFEKNHKINVKKHINMRINSIVDEIAS